TLKNVEAGIDSVIGGDDIKPIFDEIDDGIAADVSASAGNENTGHSMLRCGSPAASTQRHVDQKRRCIPLPNFYPAFRREVHGISLAGTKGLMEGIEVSDRHPAAVIARRVRTNLQLANHRFIAVFHAPDIGP